MQLAGQLFSQLKPTAMQKFFTVFLFFLLPVIASAQGSGSVKGQLYDTIARQPVQGATITVLSRKDSSLITFTMTGSDGRFDLRSLASGQYRLLITHVNYYNSNRYFSISDSVKQADLGQVVLHDRTKVLEEVVLANEAPPVTLINDTIQYNAGSFKTAPNATVEELLKKLPGVKVEKDGTVKAQGETVSRVLVDGKEFFGNDPKVATKNLPADAVDKVQVYDRQSDQAQLTGFEDGNYEKTINLKLKKDKKKGLFGKVMAGGGNKERYESKFNVNSFKGARQLSAIGMANNSNAEGFSFMDILNFSGELSRMQRGGGNININLSAADATSMGMNAGGSNSGINTAMGGGLNYNNIIGKKLDLQSSYFYNQLSPLTESHIQRQYLLPDTSYYNANSYADNNNYTHRLNLNLLYQLDSMNSLRFIPSFSYQQSGSRVNSDYATLTGQQQRINEGNSTSTGNNSGYTFRNEMSWRHKFARKGRTFSVTLQNSFNNSKGDGSLSSLNSFYQLNGSLLRRDTLNQQYTSAADLTGYTVRAVYTEPLGKRSLLELSAGNSTTKNITEKTTWDYNRNNGKYDVLNTQLSNDYENEYGYTNAGFRVRHQRQRYNLSGGLTWQQSALDGKIISDTKDSLITKRFSNLLPNARFQYNFTRFKHVTLTYSTTTNQPSVTQLQPVPDNSNPLNIREGNPELKQEFIQSLVSNLMLINPYKNKNLFFTMRMTATSNKIVNYDSLNQQTGVRKTTPVNVKGVYLLSGNLSYNLPVRKLKSTVEFSTNSTYSRNKQLINTRSSAMKENTITVFSAGPQVTLDMSPSDKFSLSLEAGMDFNRTTYSLQPEAANNYLSQEYGITADWELPRGFFLRTDFIYSINTQRAAGFNVKVPLWNASLSRQFLKFNRGEIKFSARDLLNRNVGITRNTSNSYIEDSRVLTLRQFFLLSFTYSLSKMGLNNAGGGTMRVITR